MTTALNILGTAARTARMTARQCEDFAARFSCGEIQQLRTEASELDVSLPRYLYEVVVRRRANLIRLAVEAEAQADTGAEDEAGEALQG
jgi:hypothetical protein